PAQAPAIDGYDRYDRGQKRNHDRPHTADGRERGGAKSLLGQEGHVEVWQTNLIRTLTPITTRSGNAARPIGGASRLGCPRWTSEGSNSRAVVARSRAVSSFAALSG